MVFSLPKQRFSTFLAAALLSEHTFYAGNSPELVGLPFFSVTDSNARWRILKNSGGRGGGIKVQIS